MNRAAMLLAALAASAAAAGEPPPSVAFTPQETRRILQHGPWPQPKVSDPSNRASRDPRAIASHEATSVSAPRAYSSSSFIRA